MADEPYDYRRFIPPELQASADELHPTGSRRPGCCIEILEWTTGADGVMRPAYCGKAAPPNGSWCSEHVGRRERASIVKTPARRCLACGAEPAVKYALVHSFQRQTAITSLCAKCGEAMGKAIREP